MAIPQFITKKGDAGQTDLWGGGRVPKTDLRIVANAEIDLALSALGRGYGFLPAHDAFATQISELCLWLQQRFVFFMGEVACATENRARFQQRAEALREADLERVDAFCERLRERLNEQDRTLEKWQVYGSKGPAAAEFYYIRACFRKAELAIWRMQEVHAPMRPVLLQLLNRCGDLFFLVALYLEDSSAAL